MWDVVYWTFWTWAGVALLLAIGELVVPGVFLIWLGGAAFVTGVVVALVSDLAWYTQVALFGVLSVISVMIGRRTYSGREIEGGDTLNQRGQNLVGRTFELIEPIQNGSGRIQVGDSPWRVHGPDGMVKGAKVRVIGVEGSALVVEEA